MLKERSKPEKQERGRNDALMDLIQSGAQQLLAHALNAEVAGLVATPGNY
ncbi:hypothetical protein PJI16_10735 [Nitrospira sp. MA-1]|nr:hypothetical protein [Nitrospira sp. MA-1]